MKKNLAKVIALGLVIGGVGFAGEAMAAEIGDPVKAETGVNKWAYVGSYDDLKKVNAEAEQAMKDAAAAKGVADANKEAIEAEVKRSTEKDAEHDKKIAQNEEDIKKNTGLIKDNKEAIEAEVKRSTEKDAEHDKKIAQNEEDIRKNTGLINENKQAIADETERAKGEEQRIENKFDGEVSRLDSRIDNVDQKVDKVGAMAAAMASLHTMGYDPAAPTEIAVGVGQYRDKTGLAIGAFHYPNRDFMLNFSISASDEEYMGGIGATWKIGRKSPEQLLKAEKEKEARVKLAKANAEAAAAERARVEAQQTKHAKMLAAK